MIIVNTGNGKGKSTAAVGQAVRSLGRGWKVCFIQLFKGTEFYGEQKLLKKMRNLEFHAFAVRHPGCFKDVDQALVRRQCEEALAFLDRLASARKRYDLIVLDEFNIAMRDGFMDPKVFLDVLNKFNSKSNIVITGRDAHRSLIRVADLVTEMKEIKHPYQKGIPARRGLEF